MGRTSGRGTTRHLMVAVALMALMLGGLSWFARRPYPLLGRHRIILGVLGRGAINWSDGTERIIPEGTSPLEIWSSPYHILVRWPDGSWDFYLHADAN